MTSTTPNFRAAAALAIFLALAPFAASGQSQRPTALIGARLIDGRGGPAVENAAVVFRDGVIVAAGAMKNVEIPSNDDGALPLAEVVEGRG